MKKLEPKSFNDRVRKVKVKNDGIRNDRLPYFISTKHLQVFRTQK